MSRNVSHQRPASIAAALIVSALGAWWFDVPLPGFWREAPPPPSIALIQTLSDLATTRVHVADVLEGENGHYKRRWSLHGEAVLGVDLSKVSYLRVDAARKEAAILLPQPHLISSKVDHDRSEEIYVKATAWLPLSWKEALRDEVWKQADRKVQRLGQEAGHVERARAQAERVLHRLFGGLGWTVRFDWEDSPSPPCTVDPAQLSDADPIRIPPSALAGRPVLSSGASSRISVSMRPRAGGVGDAS